MVSTFYSQMSLLPNLILKSATCVCFFLAKTGSGPRSGTKILFCTLSAIGDQWPVRPLGEGAEACSHCMKVWSMGVQRWSGQLPLLVTIWGSLGKVFGWLYLLGKWVRLFTLSPPRFLGLMGSLTLSLPVWLHPCLLIFLLQGK